jgi:hypothetical protein
MLASTLYVRVVPQDKDRGYVLLAGYDAAEVRDVTAPAIQKKLAKLFGETASPAKPAGLQTFSAMGVGHYLPKQM